MSDFVRASVLSLSFLLFQNLIAYAQLTDEQIVLLEHKKQLVHCLELLKSKQYDSADVALTKAAIYGETHQISEEEYELDLKLTYMYALIRYTDSKDRYLSGVHYAQKYIQLVFEHKPAFSKLAAVYYYLGNNYNSLEEFGLALDAYFEAMSIYQKRKDGYGITITSYTIGTTYKKLEDYDRAIEYFEEAIRRIKKHPEDIHQIVLFYDLMASSYFRKKSTETALVYLDSAISSSQKYDTKEVLSSVYSTYAQIYRSQKNYEKAIEYSSKALEVSEILKDESQKVTALGDLALSFNENSEVAKTIALLEPYLEQALKDRSYQPRLIDLKNRLDIAYTNSGYYKKAIELRDGFEYLVDSIEAVETNNQIRQAEMRAKAAEQEAAFDLLKKEDEVNKQTIKAQNTILISSFVILILVLIVVIVVYRAFRINKRLSEKNKLQADRLMQLDIAKSRFFANISHDLRTPMTLIMGGIQQVLENSELYLNEKAERQLKVGLKNGERILHLTNEINELIKMEDSKLKIEPQYIDIDKMLNLFVQMFSSMAEMKGVHLAYSRMIAKGSTIIYADPFQFEKVLFNLITNGIKHTKEEDSLTVSLNRNESKLTISILDTGEGIPEENVPYLFDRYYQAPDTTYKTQEGFGIGLALVKEIIDKHGAEITVVSQLDIGTEFRIAIDQENVSPDQVIDLSKLDYSYEKRDLFKDIEEVTMENKPLVSIESIKNDSTIDEKKKTILIVEDHPEVRDFIYDIISDHYSILTAPNGKRALKVLEKESVDLIITDLMMPWFDGFELLEQLRLDEKLRKIPALVLSARTSEEDKEKVLSKGVNDFLCKPFKPKELLLRIENLLKKTEWNNTNEDALFINSQETLDDVETSLLKTVEQLILQKIDDPNLNVAYLAGEVCVSERKFYRLIKKLTNATPYEYIKEVRMQYANKLIHEKKMSNSSEVARLIGMNNVSHFNTQFKKRFGKKPSELLDKV